MSNITAITVTQLRDTPGRQTITAPALLGQRPKAALLVTTLAHHNQIQMLGNSLSLGFVDEGYGQGCIAAASANDSTPTRASRCISDQYCLQLLNPQGTVPVCQARCTEFVVDGIVLDILESRPIERTVAVQFFYGEACRAQVGVGNLKQQRFETGFAPNVLIGASTKSRRGSFEPGNHLSIGAATLDAQFVQTTVDRDHLPGPRARGQWHQDAWLQGISLGEEPRVDYTVGVSFASNGFVTDVAPDDFLYLALNTGHRAVALEEFLTPTDVPQRVCTTTPGFRPQGALVVSGHVGARNWLQSGKSDGCMTLLGLADEHRQIGFAAYHNNARPPARTRNVFGDGYVLFGQYGDRTQGVIAQLDFTDQGYCLDYLRGQRRAGLGIILVFEAGTQVPVTLKRRR